MSRLVIWLNEGRDLHCWFCKRRLVIRFTDFDTRRDRWLCWRHLFRVREAFQ